MCKQAKDICTCISLFIFITCASALSCYSCYGDIKNALDCEIIDCEASLLGELGTSCYYVSKGDYQRRGCENMQSLFSQHLKANDIKLYYCDQDYCNGYSDIFLNDSRRQYQSKETQATDPKPSWNTLQLDSDLPSTWEYSREIQSTISSTNIILLIAAITVTILIAACACFCKKTKKPENTSGSRISYNSRRNHYNESSHGRHDYFNYADNFTSNQIANHSLLNDHSAIHGTDFKHCHQDNNDHSGISCHAGGISHHNDYGGGHYSYSADYCSGNDLNGGGGDGGDCGGGYGGDCGGDGGGDCGGGDGGDCGGGGND